MYQYKAVITRVVDGDTVDAIVDVGFSITVKQRFRIDGYDAPETWRPQNDAELAHGEKATKRAEELLLNKEVVLISSKQSGIYGRYGAIILLEDGNSFSELMIKEGYEKKDSYETDTEK